MNSVEVEDGSTPVRRTARARKVNTRFVGADIDEDYIKLVGRITASNYSELKPGSKERRSSSIEGCSDPDVRDNQDVNPKEEEVLKRLHLGNNYATVNINNLTNTNQQFNSIIKLKKVKKVKVNKDSPSLTSGEIRPSVIVQYRSSTESEASDISHSSDKKRKLDLENALRESDSLKKKCDEYDVESRLAEVLNMKPVHSLSKINEPILDSSALKQTIERSDIPLSSFEESVKNKVNLENNNYDGNHQGIKFNTSSSTVKLEQNPAKIIVTSKEDINLGLPGKKLKIVSLKIPADLQRSNQSFNNQILISNLKSLELKVIKKDSGSDKKAFSNSISCCKLPSVPDLTPKHSSKKVKKDISPNIFSSDGEDDIPLTKLISNKAFKKAKKCSKDDDKKTKKSLTKNKIKPDKLTGLKIKNLKKLVKSTKSKQLKTEITSQDDLPLQLLKETFAKVKRAKVVSNGKPTLNKLGDNKVSKKVKVKNILTLKTKADSNEEQSLKKLKSETSLIKKKTSIGVPKYEIPKNSKKKPMKFRMKFPSLNKNKLTKYNDLTNIVVSVGEKEGDYTCYAVDKNKVTTKFKSHFTPLPDEPQKKYTFVEECIVPGINQGLVLESDILEPEPKKSEMFKKFRGSIAEVDAKTAKMDNIEKNKKVSKVSVHSSNLATTDTTKKLHDSTGTGSDELTNEHSSKASDLLDKQSSEHCMKLLGSLERSRASFEKSINAKKGNDLEDDVEKKEYSPSPNEIKLSCDLISEKDKEKIPDAFLLDKNRKEKSSHKELNKPIKKSVKLEPVEKAHSKDRSENNCKQEISKNAPNSSKSYETDKECGTKEKASKISDSSDRKKYQSHGSEKRSLEDSSDGKLLKSVKYEDKYERKHSRIERDERKNSKSSKERKDYCNFTSDKKHDIDIKCNIKEDVSKENNMYNTPKKSEGPMDIKVENESKSSENKKENLQDKCKVTSGSSTKHPFELSIMFDEKEYTSKKKNKHHSRHRSRDEQISPLKSDSSFESESKIKSKNVDRKNESYCDYKRSKSHHDHKSRSPHSDSSRRLKYERDKHSEKSKYVDKKEPKKAAPETNVTSAVIKIEDDELISPKNIKLVEPLVSNKEHLGLKNENKNLYNSVGAVAKLSLEIIKKEEISSNQSYEIGENAIHPTCKSEVIVDKDLLSNFSLEINKDTKEPNKSQIASLPQKSNKEMEKGTKKVQIPSQFDEKSVVERANLTTKSLENILSKNDTKIEIESNSVAVTTLVDSAAQTKKDILITNNSVLHNVTPDSGSVIMKISADEEHSKIVYAEEGSFESPFKEFDCENSENSIKINYRKLHLKASKKDIQKQKGKGKFDSGSKNNDSDAAKKKYELKINEKKAKADFKISTNSFFRNKATEPVSEDFRISGIKNENILPCKDEKKDKLIETVKHSNYNLEKQTTHSHFKSSNEISSSTTENLKTPKIKSNMQSSYKGQEDLTNLSHLDLDKSSGRSKKVCISTRSKYEKPGKEGILLQPQLQSSIDGCNNKDDLTCKLNDSFDEIIPTEDSSNVICSYTSTSAAVKKSDIESDDIKSNLKKVAESDEYRFEANINSKYATPVELQKDIESKVDNDESYDIQKGASSKYLKKTFAPSMQEYLFKSVFPIGDKNSGKVEEKKAINDEEQVFSSPSPTKRSTYQNLLSAIPLPGEDIKASSAKPELESLSEEVIQEDNAPFMDFLSITPERKMELTNSLENNLPLSVENEVTQSPLCGQLNPSVKFEVQDPNSNCESKIDGSIFETVLAEPLDAVKELTPEEKLEIENRNKKIVEERMKAFDQLEENLYLVGKVKSQRYKGDRRMICDCTLSKEELENNETGCGEDCLNKLLMIECGSRCTLNERCMNKNFQLKSYANVEVFNAEEKGCGIRACTDIEPGTFIMEYIGEVFDTKEFKRRRKEYGKSSSAHFYFMALNQDRFIDATLKGNISRFINHSCSPNAETQKWTVNGDLRIGFFATTFIAANEEINFDYRLERYGREPQKCYCGTSVCRGWLGESPDEKTKEEKEEDRRRELRNKKKRELRSYFGDVDLEYEIEKLNLRGLRNRQDTLNLSRLMVRALESGTRMRLLKMLEDGEEACKRLFLDYHGLKLLWSWMADMSSSSSKNVPLKLEILKTLSSLPITNKTQLTESRVLDVVERWSKESSNSALEVADDKEKEKFDDSVKQSSSSCDKNELSEDSDTDTPDSKDPSPSDTTSPDDSSLDSSETPMNSQSDQIMTDLSSQVANDIIILDEDNSSSNSPLDSDSANELSISDMAMKLLPMWNNLKEVFKIPRKERLQIMKEHEREVDQEFKKYLNKNKKTDEDRTQAFYDRWRYGVDKDKDKSRKKDRKNDKKKRGKKDKDEEDKNLSKEERRERFAMQVAQEDEAARQKKLQEDLWTLHKQRCSLLGIDQNLLPIFDPSGQFYWDFNSSSWQPYIETVGNLPVLASYGPNPGLMESLCFNASTNQSFNPEAFYPLPHPPILDCDGGIKGKDATDEELALHGSPSTLDPPLSIESLKDFQKAASDDSLTSAGVLSMTIILPAKWKMASDQLGRLYFYHTKTRYSQWDVPTTDLHEKLMTQYTLTSDSESDSDSDSESSSNSEEFSSDEDDTEKEVKEEVLIQTSPGGDEKMVKRVKGQRRHSEKLVQERVISPILFEDREAARKERKEAKEKAREEARKERWSSYKSSRNGSKENKDLFESNDPVDGINDNDEEAPTDFIQFGKSSRKYKQSTDGKPTIKGKSKERMVTALADNSETARKIKESFKTCMANFIVSVLNPYRRTDCTEGRIINTEDFKYLARKLTHFVMVKELKQLPCVDELDCSESVKHKTKEFVRKYMSKYGSTFKRDPNDTKDYLAL